MALVTQDNVFVVLSNLAGLDWSCQPCRLSFHSEWKPPSNRVISVTGCNRSQVVCAAGPVLFYIEVFVTILSSNRSLNRFLY